MTSSSGIIPARAGFTVWGLDSTFTDRDHPRSRGVYVNNPGTDLVPGGSSPLARGLPEDVVPGVVIVRIIPARAGFTPAGTDFGATVKDHPRSRGVYCS